MEKFECDSNSKGVKIDNANFHCDLCDKSFLLKHNRRHYRGVHNWKNMHTCVKCNKFFELFNDLTTHLKDFHKDEKFFKCCDCEKYFTLKQNLNKHYRLKHMTKTQNKKKAGTSEILDNSRKQMKPVISGFVQCPQCDWKSTIYSEIQAHFEIHLLNKTKDMYCFEYERQTEMKKEVKEEPLEAIIDQDFLKPQYWNTKYQNPQDSVTPFENIIEIDSVRSLKTSLLNPEDKTNKNAKEIRNENDAIDWKAKYNDLHEQFEPQEVKIEIKEELLEFEYKV